MSLINKLSSRCFNFEKSEHTLVGKRFVLSHAFPVFDLLWFWLKEWQFIFAEYTLRDKSNCCKRSLLGLNPVRTDSRKLPLEDEDHSWSGPHSFSGFLYLNSGMPPQRVRSELGIVVITRLKCGFPSYWSPKTFSLSLCSQFPLRPE